MATISDLWEAFTRFQKSAYALDLINHYELGIWFEGDGTLYTVHQKIVTRWETFDEGVKTLNELALRNEQAAQNE